MNKCKMLYLIFAVSMLIWGCGSNDTAGMQPGNGNGDGTGYVAQYVSVPEYTTFDGAFVYENSLYFAASVFDQETKENDTAIYTLENGKQEPKRLAFQPDKDKAIQNMTMDADGNIYCVCTDNILAESTDGNDSLVLELYKVSKDGVLLKKFELKELSAGRENITIPYLAVDEEKHILLADSDNNIWVLEEDGNILFQENIRSSIYGMCRGGNGSVFVGYSEGDGLEIREIDINGRKLSSKYENDFSGKSFQIASSIQSGLLIATESSVYEYVPETKETMKKFDWMDYDLSGDLTGRILLPFEENGVMVVNRNYSTFPMKVDMTVLRQAKEGENIEKEKSLFTIGVTYIEPHINEEIVAFKKANPDIEIEIKEYGEWSQLNADILAGNCPDVLALPPFSIDTYAKRGVIEDLNPYFDGEETWKRSDFLENILNAYESEGHIYGIPVTFSIYTMVGKASDLGEGSEWNLDELIAFIDGVSEGKDITPDIFDDASKSGVFNALKFANLDQLVDLSNENNPLNHELLMKMLELSNKFTSDEQYVYDNNLQKKITDEQLLLMDVHITNGAYYQLFSNLFGEPVTFIGYPSSNGKGNTAYSFNTFAISSGSRNKEIAWKFIKTLLSEDVQRRMARNIYGNFPVRKDALEEHFMNIMNLNRNYGYGSYVYRSEGVKEEEIEKVRILINNVESAWIVDSDINKIIEEEAGFYFSGVKTIEEVVSVIENKVKIYASEIK